MLGCLRVDSRLEKKNKKLEKATFKAEAHEGSLYCGQTFLCLDLYREMKSELLGEKIVSLVPEAVLGFFLSFWEKLLGKVTVVTFVVCCSLCLK